MTDAEKKLVDACVEALANPTRLPDLPHEILVAARSVLRERVDIDDLRQKARRFEEYKAHAQALAGDVAKLRFLEGKA